MSLIGIDFGSEKIQAAFFDNTCIAPVIIASSGGYGVLSENSVFETFKELNKKTGNTEAAIAVPIYYNRIQRKMIREMAGRAGIDIRRIINRSSAMALAYEFNRQHRKEEMLLVCIIEKDFFEISFFEVGGGVIEVKTMDWSNTFDNMDIEFLKKSITGYEQIDTVLISGNNNSKHIKLLQLLSKDIVKDQSNIILNNEENISIGASIQGGILNGNVKDVLLLSATSKSLGIKIFNTNCVQTIIPHHTTIPTRKGIVSFKSESEKTIKVLEDEEIIGTLYIPQHIGEIAIIMDIDPNDIIHVIVKDISNCPEWTLSIM
jgi:molecular chaperone DnaK (HSP70)